MRSAVHGAYGLDEVTRSDRMLTATVQFDGRSPIFAGHYPELAVVPGVLLIDMCRRIAAELSGGDRWQIHSAQFSAPVRPEHVVSLHAEIGAGAEVRVRIRSGARQAASIRLRPDPGGAQPRNELSVPAELAGVAVVPQLPHRPPMSFLDDAVRVADDRLTAHCGQASIEFYRDTTTFSSPEPSAVWPGDLVLEAWCQAAAVLLMRLEPGFAAAAPAVLISRLSSVRHHADVAIGETIELSVRLLERYPHASTFTGHARAGERTVLAVDRLTATLRPFDQLRSSS